MTDLFDEKSQRDFHHRAIESGTPQARRHHHGADLAQQSARDRPQ